jgi:hypothetical protein
MATPATPEPDREATAYLAAVRKLRYALTERDKSIRPYRERYDRSQDDLRLMPEKRLKIGGEFLRATMRADHIYEERVNEALEEYRERIGGEEDP